MLKIGIVGCGKAAVRHATGLEKMPEWVKVVACCDIDSVGLMMFQKAYTPEAEVFTDLGFMLDSTRLDVVLISSWPVSHREQIEICINAGIRNIMVEKPLSLTAGEAYEIFKLVEANNVLIAESNAFMFQPGFSEIDTRMRSKELCPASTIHATFCIADPETTDPVDNDLDWRQCRLYGGGVPWEFASFMVTACNHFTADLPVGVYAYGSRGRYDTINRMHGMIEYLEGSVAFIHADKQVDCQSLNMTHGETSVTFPDNCWYYDPNESSSLLMNVDGTMIQSDLLPANSFLKMWTDFFDAIERPQAPGVPFIHSVVTMYTLDALVASIRQQTNIELDLPEDIMQAYEATLEGR